MSYADKMFVTIVFVAFVLLVFSIVKLVSPSHKKMLTKKPAFLALLVTPIVQLFFFSCLFYKYTTLRKLGVLPMGLFAPASMEGGLSSGAQYSRLFLKGDGCCNL